ncbi:LysE family translocator [Desulforhopalus singaporensis]|uniref:Threonine/homoserine/homoserine lactone efflux protein n=1 Tax=Desulforhopalus singaporensis TaxID=91360 RepID=A0A1H0LY90_9BACT|nr:LysE family translocator [Desulforhopalus singaporensis]SDO72890.1 Threonine/homoserine/homoserine lactone efflux protein [Desulforhopalus singaporensis]
MMDPHTLLTCLLAVTLVTLSPGVDTMLVIRNSGRGGWLDGAVSSLGICSGLFVHATLSACGISVLLLHTAWAFTALKFCGAGYLVWLGLNNLRDGFANRQSFFDTTSASGTASFSWYRSLREGFLSNVLNPKPVIFYMAFLPQFIDPAHSALVQSLIVATLHFSVGMIYQCLLAATIDKARVWLDSPKVNRAFNAMTGSILLFLGMRLIIRE